MGRGPGVFSFNSNAIKVPEVEEVTDKSGKGTYTKKSMPPQSNPTQDTARVSAAAPVNTASHSGPSAEITVNTFTDEQLECFQRRYKEGYDMYVDLDYV